MRRIRAFALLTAIIVSTSPHGGTTPAGSPQRGDPPVEPYRVIGNIYFVGAQYGSYLITTPEGLILHDTGVAGMHDQIVSNIRKLGFNPEDIRIMISSHAHFDHVEGHAAMKRLTGAQVVALGGDAVALRSGHDNSAIGARDFEPVVVDRVIEDGDTVTLGGVTLRAMATPGHTQGATVWMTTVEEGGRTYSVAFRGGEIPNPGSPLVDNPRHANVVADTRTTLQRLKAMDPPDVFLHNHPQSGRTLDAALPVNPLCTFCLDADGFRALIAGVDEDFREMLEEAGIDPGR